MIIIGADHKGLELKKEIKEWLQGQGYQAQDMGNEVYDENDDYVDFAIKVAREVGSKDQKSLAETVRGIVICGSGAGVNIVANKVDGVRAVLGFETDQVFDSRQDDDVNVLALAADFVGIEKAKQLIGVFLATPFLGEERHKRRLNKIREIEKSN